MAQMSTDGAWSWGDAMDRALYGPGGFYARGEAPGAHFRTSVHASRLFARAVGELVRRADAALGQPDPVDLVDVGAGRGELLVGVLAAVQDLAPRLRLTGVETGPRPAGLDPRIGWTGAVPELTGVLIANEWLDNVPVDVVAGGRLVYVDTAGVESAGPSPAPADAAWIRRWWPAPGLSKAGPGEMEPGDVEPAEMERDEVGRVEVGRRRDDAWGAAVGRVRRGVAVAVDYGHDRAGRPTAGTLTGYRAGRQVAPVPDGSCDLTAHVALDSAAAAGEAAGATDTLRLAQRDALHRLGVSGSRPPRELASTDPAAYLQALTAAGEAAELTDPAGLGGFGWLVQAVGIGLPLG
jgi:SAM-dependent MidA family methyltransferase